MASLQARSPLRSAHPLLFINKLISVSALVALLAGGWMAVSYIRAELGGRWQSPADGKPAAAAIEVNKSDMIASEAKRQPVSVRLVYSCGDDTGHYHAPAHLRSHCARTALTEEAALRRGLKRCLTCLPE